MPSIVVGIDVGGTKIAAGAATRDGIIVHDYVVPTPAEAGPDAVAAQIVDAVRNVTARAGYPLAAVDAIGVGIAGPTSTSRGMVYTSPNLKGWHNVPLREMLEARLGRSVRIDNDAKAATCAEHRWGAGQGIDDFVYITVGTGIGGGIVVNGRLVRGAAETAGEIGHTTIDYDGPRCRCGNYGCLELYASGTAIERRAAEALAGGANSRIAELAVHNPEGVSAAIVQRAALEGDDLAQRLFDEAGTFLGVGIANLANLLSPRVVAVGGGVAAAGELLLGPARAEVARRAFSAPAAALTIVPSSLPRKVGLLGAIALALLPD